MPDAPWLIASLGLSLCLNFLVFKSCFPLGSLHSKLWLTLQSEVMTHAGVFKQVQGRQENRDLLFLPPGGLTWRERLRVPGLCSSEHSFNLKSHQRKRNTVCNSVMRRADTTLTVKGSLCGSRATWDGSCGLFNPGWITCYTILNQSEMRKDGEWFQERLETQPLLCCKWSQRQWFDRPL